MSSPPTSPDGLTTALAIETKPFLTNPTRPQHPKRCLRPICRATETNQWCTSPDGRNTLCHRCYALYLAMKLPLFRHPLTSRLSILRSPDACPVRVTGFAVRHRARPTEYRRPRRNAAKPFVVPLTDCPRDRELLRMTDVAPNVGRRGPVRTAAVYSPISKRPARHTRPGSTRILPRAAKLIPVRKSSPADPFNFGRADTIRRAANLNRVDKSATADPFGIGQLDDTPSPNTVSNSDASYALSASRDTEDREPDVQLVSEDDDDAHDGWLSVPRMRHSRPAVRLVRSQLTRPDGPSLRRGESDRHLSVTNRLFRRAIKGHLPEKDPPAAHQLARPHDFIRNQPRPKRKTPTRVYMKVSLSEQIRRQESTDQLPDDHLSHEEMPYASRKQAARGHRSCPLPSNRKSSNLVAQSLPPFKGGASRTKTPAGCEKESGGSLIGVKAEFNGDIRRLRILPDASRASFMSQLQTLFEVPEILVLKYLDEEDDFVTVANETDMTEMIYMVREHNLSPLRVHLQVERTECARAVA
ncbi:unnamed protein product [Chondrus crispus]|uniref:PB1 domain-containing protein n=1 Tax=Chondrus crispus TaxID=2769 RepID=R7QC62_CHOCR|nr:unnamed protein product [Chondrus crispus]CDF35669.1 unnamed protein product [Chondrus crispus]|eukprot:XP_005715488.1 unnamed protein product [Chondrus crispus]